MARRIPISNISFDVEGGYLVIFRQGPKWIIAPFDTFEEAEKHADWLEQKWTATQIHILRNT